VLSMGFTMDPGGVAACRRFVVNTLGGWPETTIEKAVLLASELVSNSIVHASSGVLAVGVVHGSLRLEVLDGSREAPKRLPHGSNDSHGRGLHIVDALADDWGVDISDSGKTVWATIESPG
jgi:anti-sigma regulatory factor (Ser/Thr protein kinase)